MDVQYSQMFANIKHSIIVFNEDLFDVCKDSSKCGKRLRLAGHFLPSHLPTCLSFRNVIHYFSSHDAATVDAWDGCTHYLYRSVARQALFMTASAQPAADLGPANIAKCKGFMQNLMDLSLTQRNGLTHVVTQFIGLRYDFILCL